MTTISGCSQQTDAKGDQLLIEVLRSLGRVLAAAGVSTRALEEHADCLLAAARTTGGPSEALNLGSMQRQCMEVMCLWRRDPRFLDSEGWPAALSLGEESTGFRALCREAGVTADPAELLEILGYFRAIHLDTNGTAVPLTPTFLLGPQSATGVVASDGVLKQLAGFLRVLEHNLLGVHEGRRPRFERACSVRVALELLPVFERFVAERAQEFIDSVDEWLERQKLIDSKSGETVEVGAGAYFLDAPTNK